MRSGGSQVGAVPPAGRRPSPGRTTARWGRAAGQSGGWSWTWGRWRPCRRGQTWRWPVGRGGPVGKVEILGWRRREILEGRRGWGRERTL